jgi:ectoine hydroxylase-related dioxygenase (phytanoyl-CoA dioxygenase family)
VDVRERFACEGYLAVAGAVTPSMCDRLGVAFDDMSLAGTRNTLACAAAHGLLAQLRACPDLASLLPSDAVAVQCTFFQKSAARNWLVSLHQDRSIPVRSRVSHPALRGWSEKEGVLYVQPPVEVLQQMVAVRVHLDPCDTQDGPLRVVPGSHRQGVVRNPAAMGYTERVCLAQMGDVLAMRPLLLHASSKASGTSRRRVLHVLFGPAELPSGLAWAQIA